jgi:hypothetical protein
MAVSSCLKKQPDQIAQVFGRKAADRIRRQGLILNAQIRPHRRTAAANDKYGRGVDHGRGYKAPPGLRQGSNAVVPGCATRTRVYPNSALSMSKSATADLDAQTRHPEIRTRCWIPGSRFARPGMTASV